MIELKHIANPHGTNMGRYFTIEGHITDPNIIKKTMHELKTDPLVLHDGNVVGKVYDWRTDQNGLWVYIKIV